MSTHPFLVKYLTQLKHHPLRTKAITTGTLCFLQEVLGSTLAGVSVNKPSNNAPLILRTLASLNVDIKALKMAVYGFLVSAPTSHVLTGRLQKAFAGKTGTGAKVAQLLANNLLIAPIQTITFLASMAIINGAKTVDEVIRTVKAGFFPVLKITWVVSPISLAIAQKFVPVDFWVPFFNIVQFVLGTFFNARVKRLKKLEKEKGERDNSPKT